MWRTIWAVLLLAATQLPYALHSAEPQDAPSDRRSRARTAAANMRRDWLRNQLAPRMQSPAQVAQLNARLERMTPEQINKLCAQYLDQLRRRREQQAKLREEQQRQRRSIGAAARPANNHRAPQGAARATPANRARLGSHRRGRGFLPIITWLPDGTSFTASAVVSPDRRSVRIHAFPFFSTVGPVHSFNFFTGETRLLHPGPQDPFAHSPVQPRIYHDGLRTRVEAR